MAFSELRMPFNSIKFQNLNWIKFR